MRMRRVWIDFEMYQLIRRKQLEYQYKSMLNLTRDVDDLVLRKRKRPR